MAAGHSKTLAAKAPPVAHVPRLLALKFFVPLPRMKVRKHFWWIDGCWSFEDTGGQSSASGTRSSTDCVEILRAIALKEDAQAFLVDRWLLVIRRHWRPKLRQWHTFVD
jgi:hypothetical protein